MDSFYFSDNEDITNNMKKRHTVLKYIQQKTLFYIKRAPEGPELPQEVRETSWQEFTKAKLQGVDDARSGSAYLACVESSFDYLGLKWKRLTLLVPGDFTWIHNERGREGTAASWFLVLLNTLSRSAILAHA